MGQFPWGFKGLVPNASENLPDHGAFTRGALQFTDDGALTGSPVHHYAALVGSDRTPISRRGRADRRRVPRAAGRARLPGRRPSAPSVCDDGPFGHGTGGQLRYRVKVPAHGARTVWIAAAGSDKGLGAARAEFAKALRDPKRALAAKVAARRTLARQTQLSLPGDRLLQRSIDWGKQNLADLTLRASDLQVRWTNQGKQFPAPLGTVKSARWFGAGFPDYPWIFATDGEYTAFAAMALGQFQTAEDHLRSLRDISDVLNDRSGIVVHETVADGSVYFGHDSQTTNPDTGAKTNDFNTDETIKFPSIVALIWRWTGDDRFRDDMYDFAKRNLHAVDDRLDVDKDGWPEGSGNVERPGMGPEKLDNGVYYIRSLLDLADMARSKHDDATVTWATGVAAKLQKQFETTWWSAKDNQYADSLLDPGNTQSFLKHWIGQVPMEAELTSDGEVTPGVAAHDHGDDRARGARGPLLQRRPPRQPRPLPHRLRRWRQGQGRLRDLLADDSIQAVGEGNYGRLGAGQQKRYTDANAETMFSEPATGNTPDEQPGAMPEIFPSAPNGDPSKGIPPNIDRCWTCRSMFMQAWGNYGTAWPVVHQQLGVRPDIGNGRLEVVPQVPGGQSRVAGSSIRLGRSGSLAVEASHDGAIYRTRVQVGRPVSKLAIGHTLPAGATVAKAKLDGRRVTPTTRSTNRGLEVTVATGPGTHTLVVTAG